MWLPSLSIPVTTNPLIRWSPKPAAPGRGGRLWRRAALCSRATLLVYIAAGFILLSLIKLIILRGNSYFQSYSEEPWASSGGTGGQIQMGQDRGRQLLGHKSSPSSSSNSSKTVRSSVMSSMPEYLWQRREHLRRKCSELGLDRAPANPWEFAVNYEYGLVYCNVFKAASTSWISVFNQLGDRRRIVPNIEAPAGTTRPTRHLNLTSQYKGLLKKDTRDTNKSPVGTMRTAYPRPSLDELEDAVDRGLAFLVVRDPFERLLSAYRDKFERSMNVNYRSLGAKISAEARIRRGMPLSEEGLAYLTIRAPSFPDFVDYVLETEAKEDKLNEHWVPVSRFCTPCSVDFLVVAKTETLQKDSDFILKAVGAPPEIKVVKKNSNPEAVTQAVLERYFSRLNKRQLLGLKDLYFTDFQIFGYDFGRYEKIFAQKLNEVETSDYDTA